MYLISIFNYLIQLGKSVNLLTTLLTTRVSFNGLGCYCLGLMVTVY